MEALHLWRVEIAKRDHSKALISGLGLLSDDLVELLSSLGPIATEAALVKQLGDTTHGTKAPSNSRNKTHYR